MLFYFIFQLILRTHILFLLCCVLYWAADGSTAQQNRIAIHCWLYEYIRRVIRHQYIHVTIILSVFFSFSLFFCSSFSIVVRVWQANEQSTLLSSQCCLYTMKYMWQPHVIFTQYTTATCTLLINPPFVSMYLRSMVVLLYLALYNRIEAEKYSSYIWLKLLSINISFIIHSFRRVPHCSDSNCGSLNYRLKMRN